MTDKQPDYWENIEKDFKLVKVIAGRIKRNISKTADYDDIFQDGCIGLLEAHANWDESQGASFNTYAGIRIRGEIYDGLRRLTWQPRSYSRARRKLENAVREVEKVKLGPASHREIAEKMSLSLSDYFDLVNEQYKQFIPLYCRDDEDSIITPIIELAAATPGIDSIMIAKEDNELLAQAIEKIGKNSSRRRLVFDMYSIDNLTEAAIGVIIGVSESRVCQLLREAIEIIKTELEILKNAQFVEMFRQLEEKYQKS